ncbi:hypothetical protein AB1Y20_018182 [Prymnesium parvum]|uniref:Uncharacterized protein n=1 Tax=Prymnesium parvum TaxID=97485 RepID=A0AB34JRB8_PRYPA|mmetsp:Transcript_26982/g.61904  ORF Transcript_26982/g.61904 Transcript_26982/m.61904 type:complete len:241 (+) Transcript_26982:671-1393(+)
MIHAATDKIFWGRREAMAVAAGLYPAIGPVFETSSADPLRRRIDVQLLLNAALSLPHAAWSTRRSERQHYNKVAMLPFPMLAGVKASRSPRETTIENLRAVLEVVGRWIDPTHTASGLRVVPGLRAGSIDREIGVFVAERDFLIWVLSNNISLCDLGADTTALLYKGEKHPRQSLSCPSEKPDHRGIRNPSRSQGPHEGLHPAFKQPYVLNNNTQYNGQSEVGVPEPRRTRHSRTHSLNR